MRPLLDDENYIRMERLASEFKNGIAVKLQRYLILKSWWSSNYVSDWWEEYVYLRGRSALMVNSNFYGIDAILMHPSKIQAARAAATIHSCLQYRRLIERQELEPVGRILIIKCIYLIRFPDIIFSFLADSNSRSRALVLVAIRKAIQHNKDTGYWDG